MKVYIASSWRNEHAVRMLTDLLRAEDIEVISFIERAAESEKLAHNPDRKTLEEWIWSDDGEKKFDFDTDGATRSDVVVYVGPSGTDAWAEVGAAWANGITVMGLWAKSEPAGLMRRMVHWYSDYHALVESVKGYKQGGF